MIARFRIKHVLLLVFTLLLTPLVFSFDAYVPFKLISNSPYVADLYPYAAYVCQSPDNCQTIAPIDYQLFYLQPIKSCFEQYNRNDIQSCVQSGLTNHVVIGPHQSKEIVVKFDLPSKDYYRVYIILTDKNHAVGTPVLLYYTTNPSISQYNINYINEVYWYLNGDLNADINIEAYNLDNRPVIILNNINVQNEIDVNLPLLIGVPIGISSEVCNLIHNRFSQFYIPDELKKI